LFATQVRPPSKSHAGTSSAPLGTHLEIEVHHRPNQGATVCVFHTGGPWVANFFVACPMGGPQNALLAVRRELAVYGAEIDINRELISETIRAAESTRERAAESTRRIMAKCHRKEVA
jgi:hypothetical protein